MFGPNQKTSSDIETQTDKFGAKHYFVGYAVTDGMLNVNHAQCVVILTFAFQTLCFL